MSDVSVTQLSYQGAFSKKSVFKTQLIYSQVPIIIILRDDIFLNFSKTEVNDELNAQLYLSLPMTPDDEQANYYIYIYT